MIDTQKPALAERVAIITGGARGIGAAVARKLLADGAAVAITGLPADRERAAALRASLQHDEAERLTFHQGDVGDFADCERVVAEVSAKRGRVDILVNNAGITQDKTIRKMSVAEWEAVLRVNLSGPFFMTKAVFGHMLDRGFGRIVNMSSVVGLAGNFGQANYASSKAGLLGLTKTTALEGAAHNVTANAVAPGFVATDMVAAMPPAVLEAAIKRTPVGRLAEPDEVAHLVRFLVDDRSGYVTGTVVSINGGWYM
ncbi:MAG TPA: 3-oxoacyl-ACP reductase [Candidatus Eremiobacteraceae bacterium]|jgi:NAD(P)-dependent dehydrogenase (short-subunit alcohol dehydrogenase family)